MIEVTIKGNWGGERERGGDYSERRLKEKERGLISNV